MAMQRLAIMQKITGEDQAKALELFQELKTQTDQVSNHIQGLLKKVDNGELSTAKGISFLEVKNQSLLSYLINLTHLMLHKSQGQSIQGEPCIDRLVEIRTVLEKMRPIDQKLKYQIDKVIKTAATGKLGENDPLRFKPNPDNLQSKLEDESSDDESSDEEKTDRPRVYKPPKLAAMHYEGDDTVKDRQEKALERARKRALSSNIMKELRDEYYEGPEEVVDTADLHRSKADKAGKEREEYEENYFVRMSVSKKSLNASKKLRTMADLDDITHFRDIGALTGERPDSEGVGVPKKKKRKLGAKGKKKGFKKRRRH